MDDHCACSNILEVNRDGVAGVMWYDRRDTAHGPDYTPRFAASLDGCATWTPSVAVSTAANARAQVRDSSSFFPTGGDTAGRSADAERRFHALWIDNRTGVEQVWTAIITVKR